MSRATGAAPRQARRRQQTRSALLSAGQQLFAERSFDDVSIDEIVEAADVAKGSFYNHFGDKSELAGAIFELIGGDCEFHIMTANRDIDDPAQRMARALCVMLRYALNHPERLQAMISLSARKTVAQSHLNAGLSADITDGLAKGRMQGVDLEVGVIVVLGVINVATRHLLTSGTTTPPVPFASAVGAALLRALGVDQGDALAEAAAADLLSMEASSATRAAMSGRG